MNMTLDYGLKGNHIEMTTCPYAIWGLTFWMHSFKHSKVVKMIVHIHAAPVCIFLSHPQFSCTIETWMKWLVLNVACCTGRPRCGLTWVRRGGAATWATCSYSAHSRQSLRMIRTWWVHHCPLGGSTYMRHCPLGGGTYCRTDQKFLVMLEVVQSVELCPLGWGVRYLHALNQITLLVVPNCKDDFRKMFNYIL